MAYVLQKQGKRLWRVCKEKVTLYCCRVDVGRGNKGHGAVTCAKKFLVLYLWTYVLLCRAWRSLHRFGTGNDKQASFFANHSGT
jgi:hypothetical protein